MLNDIHNGGCATVIIILTGVGEKYDLRGSSDICNALCTIVAKMHVVFALCDDQKLIGGFVRL